MPYGSGFGRGCGFRGYSPPWPNVGQGRGGLPRCWAYGYGFHYGAVNPNYEMMYSDQRRFETPGRSPFVPAMSPDQELNFLKNQAEVLRQHLDQIDARVKELGHKTQ